MERDKDKYMVCLITMSFCRLIIEVCQKVSAMDLPDTWNNYKSLLTLVNSNNENSVINFLSRLCSPYEYIERSRKVTQLFALAIEMKNCEIVPLLLHHGVRGNSCNELFIYTPMQRAVIWGYWKLILEFVQFGVTYDEVDKEGNTLLHLAILNKNEQYDSVEHVPTRKLSKYQTEDDIVNILKILLDLGLDINAVNNKGESPLSLAVVYKMKSVTKLLAERNAIPIIFGNSVSHFLIMEKIESSCKKKTPTAYKEDWPWAEQHKQEFRKWWFSKKFDINYRGNFEIPLILCAKENMVHMLDDLLKYTNGISAIDIFGRSFLHILLGFIENLLRMRDETCNIENIVNFCKQLIRKGVSVNKVDKCGNTPFHIAGKLKRIDMFQIIIKRFTNVNACNHLGDTALHILMRNYEYNTYEDDADNEIHGEEYLQIVDKLYLKGADLNFQDKYGNTLLHIMCLKKSSVRFVQFFVERNCDVNIKNANGVTPLYLAIQAKNTDIIKILMDNGADGNCCEKTTHSTPLHEAIKNNLEDVVESMLTSINPNFCDVNVRDANGVTPLYLAIQEKNIDIIGLLLDNEADVNCCDKITNSTPLHEAIKSNLQNVVRLLLGADAKINVKDKFGQTPLHIAATEDVLSDEIMSLLLSYNADIEVYDNNKKTPLCIAFEENEYERVKLLLRNGAKITIDRNQLLISKTELRREPKGLKILIIKHLIAQFLAGFPVKNCYNIVIQRTRRDLAPYFEECLEELKMIKNSEIEGVCLYDLLCMNFKRRYNYLNKESFKHTLTDYEYLKKEFPIYKNIISASYWRSVWRKPLLDLAKDRWYKLTTIPLPEMCLEFILAHLENLDLKFIIEAAM